VAGVVFGLPAYEGAAHVAEALESLLAQDHDDLAVIVVDDASSDATAEIVERYAAADPRVTVVRNPRRVGMVENWRRCFTLARDRHPEASHFAWASDHDAWHPRWLGVMLAEFARTPGAVLAYPANVRISETGAQLRPPVERRGGRIRAKTTWSFETRGERRPGRRFRAAVGGMSAGNMVYGLWNADALERAGIFEPVLAPDRLVVAQAALEGEFVQSREILWYRRFRIETSSDRQRRALFTGSEAGWRARWPWWASHAVLIARHRGPLRGLEYAALGLTHVAERKLTVWFRHRRSALLKRFAWRPSVAVRRSR
jgi:glycosyltransferase involved in cell wall biosynthesis